jgi:hypothetical protein
MASQATWKQRDVFPIIARLIRDEHSRHGRFVLAREIAARLLQDGEGRAIIDAARQQRQDRSLEFTARNMVSWFSQRITIGESDWRQAFERTKIDGRWAYKPTGPI